MESPDERPLAGHESAGAWVDLAVLTLIGLVLFFALGRVPLANPDEGRYAQIPREMMAQGDWVTPRLNGIPYFEKPPLVYWTVGASIYAFDSAEWAVRLTPALFGLGGVLLTYAAARRMHGRVAGLAAAVVLGTSLLYFALSRILLLDMAVSVLMSATLFCFILGVREPASPRRRWFFHGLYVSAALATLTKGLIGFLVTGAVMFLWLLIFNQWKRLRPLHLPTGILLFLGIAAPWHILAAQRNPEWAHFYFVHEHWERFTTTGHDRYEPWWYFIPVLLLGLFPWTGFLWCSTRDAIVGSSDGLKAAWARRRENAEPWFFVTWVVFVFLFFSKSQSKLIPYILPVFPALAVLIGAWLARCWADQTPARLRRGLGVFSFVCGMLGVAALVMVLKPGAVRDPAQAADLRPFGLALGAIFLLGGIAAPWAARVRGVMAGIGTLLGTTLGFLLVLVLAAPGYQRAGTKELAAVASARMQPADRVYHYWAFFHDFLYYTQRPVGLVSYIDELEVQFLPAAERAARFIDDAALKAQWAEAPRVWVVLRKRDAENFRKGVTASYHLIGESRGHYLVSNRP
ncbi:MAG TPA: glycosyltransferase family 39 protein [Opitutaceae bacterium]|nr:glycosyltransferase family 39 protein [Opitutaceae bacterium]